MEYENLVLETERLILRPFEPGDAAALCALGRESQKSLFLPDWALDEEQAAGLIRFFRHCMQNPDPRTGPVVWAVVWKATGELIGNAGVGPKEELGGEVELGYAVSESFAGCGLATEAARAVATWAFGEAGMELLVAIVLPENAASRRVLEKLGFALSGRRSLEHGGAVKQFEYFQLLRGNMPACGAQPLLAEPMGAFFDSRAEGYEAHMREDPDFDSFYAGATEMLPISGEKLEILDLGCGTGLELEALFARLPNARVTCIDLSEAMLAKLRGKYKDKLSQLVVIRASYLDWEYPAAAFDHAVSVYTMHHFLEPRKLEIYRKIHASLKPGGVYVEADFMVDGAMMEEYLARYRQIVAARGETAADGAMHIDIPFTVPVQKRLLAEAGFTSVESHLERIRPEHSGAILAARKPN